MWFLKWFPNFTSLRQDVYSIVWAGPGFSVLIFKKFSYFKSPENCSECYKTTNPCHNSGLYQSLTIFLKTITVSGRIYSSQLFIMFETGIFCCFIPILKKFCNYLNDSFNNSTQPTDSCKAAFLQVVKDISVCDNMDLKKKAGRILSRLSDDNDITPCPSPPVRQ